MRLESICPACGKSFKNSHVEMRLFCSVGCQADSLQAQADAIRGEGSREAKHLPPLKPRDARILRVACEHSAEGRFRVHLTEEEWQRITESYDRIFQDRYDLLGLVYTKEGMLASEWVMRTATAERERDEARVEIKRLRAERDKLCAEVERLRWDNEMACENTPTRDCECPGCAVARARAEDGATGPSPWKYRCQSCGSNLAEVVVDGVKLPRVERCDDCAREREANEP